jgi:hypothetical protein
MMSDSNEEQIEQIVLVPVAERQVDFYGDLITGFIAPMPDEVLQVFIPIRPLCDYLGLTWAAQYNRLKRDEVLWATVSVMKTVGADGKQRDMICLPLDMLPGWLFGITAKRVKPELQGKITRYRQKCFRVLWEAFQDEILPSPAASIESPGVQELQRIVEMGEAMAHMARQQIEFQQQQEYLAQRLNKAGQVVKAIQEDVADVQDDVAAIQVRLGTVEDKLHPHAYITDEQAAHLAVTVKALAELLTEKHGKNQYQGIYNELYRRFGVSGYKLIRRELYDDVLAFLEDWRAAAMKGKQLPGGEEQ